MNETYITLESKLGSDKEHLASTETIYVELKSKLQ